MEEFNLRSNSFETYVERANFYFEANGMNEKQLVVFWALLGENLWTLMKITGFILLNEKSLAEVILVFPSMIAKRFNKSLLC